MAKRGEESIRPGGRIEGRQSITQDRPIVQGLNPGAVGTVVNPISSAPRPEQAAAPAPAPRPKGPAAPPDIPGGQAPANAQAPVPPGQVATPGQRPGTQQAQQSLAARAGVRIGAFDPRLRGQEDQGRAIAAIMGMPQAATAAQSSASPPSLGFAPRQFEDEQSILGALRG